MSLFALVPDPDLLRQIAERSPDGFFIFNLKTHRFDYVNAALHELVGEQRLDGELANLPAIIHPQDLLIARKAYERLLSSAYRQSLECRLHSGEQWIKLTAYAIIHDGQRQALVGFAEDITYQKENEITANKFSLQKNAMLEMLAHDLGGPLGVIRQLASQLEEESRTRDYQAMAEQVGLIRKTSERSIRLISELLEREFLETAETALKKQRVDLVEQLEALVDEFRKVEGSRHPLQLESTSSQVLVEVDQTKFMQVLANLVLNAVKFTPDGRRITVGVQPQETKVRVWVADEGIGIPASLQPVLFDRFTPARRPGLRGEDTVGLGLSIVKRIVELHQGRIWVESQENQGSTFFIEIPANS